jgi:hypothetical protein
MCSHCLPTVSTTQAKLVAKFAAGVDVTGGKFAAGVVDIGLPPISTTPAANFAASVVDTGVKFATGVDLITPRIL